MTRPGRAGVFTGDSRPTASMRRQDETRMRPGGRWSTTPLSTSSAGFRSPSLDRADQVGYVQVSFRVVRLTSDPQRPRDQLRRPQLNNWNIQAARRLEVSVVARGARKGASTSDSRGVKEEMSWNMQKY